MEPISKTRLRLQKARKIVFRTLLTLILLLLTLVITLSIPAVQTRIADYAADRINSDYKTDIRIKSVALTLFGGVKFREVMIRDHHKDTLVFANRIQTNILSFRKLYNGDLLFGDSDNDRILGGGGDDIVFGGIGSDRLNGQEGDDLLESGPGHDTVNGGEGDHDVSIEDLFDSILNVEHVI